MGDNRDISKGFNHQFKGDSKGDQSKGGQVGVRPWIHPNDGVGVGDDEMNEQRTLSRNKGGIVFVVLLYQPTFSTTLSTYPLISPL